VAPATHQLTDFLSVVADRPNSPAAQQAAVECAALALEADIAVLIIDDAVAAAVGLAPERVPVCTLTEAAASARTGWIWTASDTP
jgi:SpoU rRNA methylase family enzyme